MKLKLLMVFVLAHFMPAAQPDASNLALLPQADATPEHFSLRTAPFPATVHIEQTDISPNRWKLTRNHAWTGLFVFLAGASKGFNETLHYHWKEFHRQFPGANARWFYPAESWKNKYRNNDPDAGPKFFLSTSVLVMFTDQYHLNNFINKMAWGSAVVVKLGEKRKPWKQYILDFLYYALCHQAGFALTYYPFSKYKGK